MKAEIIILFSEHHKQDLSDYESLFKRKFSHLKFIWLI